jgi:hypothetical protein
MGEKRRQLRELLVSFYVYREMSNFRRGLEMIRGTRTEGNWRNCTEALRN